MADVGKTSTAEVWSLGKFHRVFTAASPSRDTNSMETWTMRVWSVATFSCPTGTCVHGLDYSRREARCHGNTSKEERKRVWVTAFMLCRSFSIVDNDTAVCLMMCMAQIRLFQNGNTKTCVFSDLARRCDLHVNRWNMLGTYGSFIEGIAYNDVQI